MRLRMTKRVTGIAAAVAAILMAPGAKATIVDIVDLASYGIGYIRPTLAGSHFTITALQNMVTTYNGNQSPVIIGDRTYTKYQGTHTPANLGTVPTLLEPEVVPDRVAGGSGPTSIDITLSSPYLYLATQWDGGADNAANAVYYIGGLTSFTLKNDDGLFVNKNGTPYGLSGYWLSTPVPEPTTVLAGALLLLPFGASTLRILRKKNVAG